MSKQTAWAHLPNAHHIDRILVDLETRQHVWRTARDTAWDAEWYEPWGIAWDAAWNIARGEVWDAVWDKTGRMARISALGAARSAILALVAWDDAGDILDMPTDAVRLLAASGHHPAVLLLPAAVALATTL